MNRPVTAHAVLRYLTRIEGFDLKPVVKALGRDAGNTKLAIAAAEAFGATFDGVQQRILPDNLVPAVIAGVGRIRREGMVLICEGRKVVTVTEALHQKCMLRSRRELKKGVQQIDRRKRHARA
jgi:hypothetical protein